MTAVDDLCRSYLDLKYHFDPASASAAGLVSQDGRIGSFDGESVRTHVAALRSLTGAVEELEPDDLHDEIDRTALLGEMRSTIFRLEHERPHLRNPGFWLAHLLQGLYALLSRHAPDFPSRVPAVLSRLEGAPAFLDLARETIDDPPPVFVDTALSMLGGGGQLIAEIVAAFAGAAPGVAERLKSAGQSALQALIGFGTAMRHDIQPSSDSQSFAIGEDQFARRLQHEHALMAGGAELWRYGLRLQEEVTAEIVALAGRLDARPWRDVVDGLRNDAPPAEELLSSYRQEIDRATNFVLEYDLVTMPDAPLDVVPTPAFLAALVPFAAYQPPPIYLADRTGRFYVTAPDPALPPEIFAQQRRGHCRYAIPAMVAHEAYPGHHLHLVSMQGLRSEVRRHVSSPVMVEGWALYSEQLMDEKGYYAGEEARLFQLVNLLWRAVRIVLDVGLHTRGMTPAQAVEYMVEHLPIERSSAEAEVRRYCAWPTYQLCYAVGRRDLLRLRDAYMEREGSAYRARRFHDELMSYGGLPVSMASWGMGLAQ